MRIKSSYKSGMTMVELLTAVGIFVVIMIAVTAFQSNIFIYNSSISGSFQTAQNAQVILKTILTEVREASPGGNGSYAIANAASTSLSFFSDVNNDGVTELVTYTLVGTNLFRAIVSGTGNPIVYNIGSQSTTTLLSNVTNGSAVTTFQYYDTNYNGTSTPLTYPITATNVRLVRVNVRLDLDPNRSPIPTIYTVQAGLRNLKSNL